MIEISIDDLPDFLRGGINRLPLECRVLTRGVSVPLLYSHKTATGRLVVFYNGAVDRKVKPEGILFQRSTWLDDVPASCLFLADPTLPLHEGLALGWGQIDADTDFPAIAADISASIARTLRLDQRGPVIHFGSSAGGFQAASAAAKMPGGTALVNNAQFDWTLYEMDSQVDAVVKLLGFSSKQELRATMPWRTSIPEYVKHYDASLNIKYLVNASSSFDVARQVPVFERLAELPSVTAAIHRYEDMKAGHDPLGRKELMSHLADFLAETESPTDSLATQ